MELCARNDKLFWVGSIIYDSMFPASKLNSWPASISKQKCLVRFTRERVVPIRDRYRWTTGCICGLVLEGEEESGCEKLKHKPSEPLSESMC
jgi:hypothetical protein